MATVIALCVNTDIIFERVSVPTPDDVLMELPEAVVLSPPSLVTAPLLLL